MRSMVSFVINCIIIGAVVVGVVYWWNSRQPPLPSGPSVQVVDIATVVDLFAENVVKAEQKYVTGRWWKATGELESVTREHSGGEPFGLTVFLRGGSGRLECVPGF